MDTPHSTLRQYVRVLAKSDTNSLVVKGSQGIGKSHSVMSELENMGYKEGINFLYLAGHITPLKLFNTLTKVLTLEYPKLFIFDDIDSLVSNKTSVALLKSALGEVRGKRIITYESTSSKVEGGGSVDFSEGKCLLILNDLKQEGAFGKPLLDRCIVYDMTLSQSQLIEYINNTIRDIDCGLDIETKNNIWREIKQFSDNQRFSMRSLVRAFEFYKYDKDKWKSLFISGLSLSPEQKIYYELEGKSEKEKVDEYIKQTGRSRRSYFRGKKVSAKVPELTEYASEEI
jgi:hypothetical protein